MNGSWFFDENFNGVPDDFFDDAMKYLDFPLEDVEPNDAGEDWETKFQHLVPPPSNVSTGFTSGENSNDVKIKKSCSVLCDESTQQKPWPSTAEASSSRSVPLNYDSLEGKYLHPFWTSSSPVSVLESSSSSSSAENATVYHPKFDIPVKRPRSKRPRPQRRTFPFISITYASKRNHPLESSESQSESYSDETMLDLAMKKQQKRKNPLSSSEEMKKPSSQKAVEIRKCTHCEVTKTPQWREGPMGPKTLCNACGVRYRSGRLFPEYRPAASPTFVPSVHSNSHRKVVEMRKTSSHVSTSEDVEPNDAGEDWEVIQHLVPPPSNVLTGFTSGENSDNLKIKKSCSILCDESSQPKRNHPLDSSETQSESYPDETMSNIAFKKKQKRKNLMVLSCSEEMKKPSSQKAVETRKCTHCEDTKTPQWRKGPMGITLCNACGLQYWLGRLFPEYRPAAIPTFVPSVYSNSHRKCNESSLPKRNHPLDSSESQSESYPDETMLDIPKKKQQKRKYLVLLSYSEEMKKPSSQKAVEARKCTHCEVTKTPEWREGPMGPKTLCNACGICFSRSGRLFSEYRPAASPTFVPSVHSNSHRKCDESSQPERNHPLGSSESQSESYPDETMSNLAKKKQQKRKNLLVLSCSKETKKPPSQKAVETRKCTNCEVTRTPQWREGPMGLPLCNACADRYRSGGLFPEYCLTSSPIFVPSVHSNSHRKCDESSQPEQNHPLDSSETQSESYPDEKQQKRKNLMLLSSSEEMKKPSSQKAAKIEPCKEKAAEEKESDATPYLMQCDESSQPEQNHPLDSSETQSESYPSETMANLVKKKQQKRKNQMLLSSSEDTKKPSSQKAVKIRKCAHCEVTKTPQWREGPMGRIMLCNACEVHYKRSGRLFSEYRPCASPTYAPSVHSNSHSKCDESSQPEQNHPLDSSETQSESYPDETMLDLAKKKQQKRKNQILLSSSEEVKKPSSQKAVKIEPCKEKAAEEKESDATPYLMQFDESAQPEQNHPLDSSETQSESYPDETMLDLAKKRQQKRKNQLLLSSSEEMKKTSSQKAVKIEPCKEKAAEEKESNATPYLMQCEESSQPKQNHPLNSSKLQSESYPNEPLENLAKKKQQKRKNLMLPSSSEETKKPSSQAVKIRKCTHCEATKTPQWREGPMGGTTLCNACGVHYKRLGRLFSEYRPAASPTFVPSLHSNLQRKVIEMIKTSSHLNAPGTSDIPGDGYLPPP